MFDVMVGAMILTGTLVIVLSIKEYKCKKRRDERNDRGDTLEFM